MASDPDKAIDELVDQWAHAPRPQKIPELRSPPPWRPETIGPTPPPVQGSTMPRPAQPIAAEIAPRVEHVVIDQRPQAAGGMTCSEVVLVGLGGMILLLLLLTVYCATHEPDPAFVAEYEAEKCITRNELCPATAKVSVNQVLHVSQHVYGVRADVDSQNVFGAVVRRRVYVEVEFGDDNKPAGAAIVYDSGRDP